MVAFRRAARAGLVLLVAAIAATGAAAQDRGPWTSVGSTGVPDEEDAAFVEFGQTGGGISIEHGTVFLRPNAPAPIQVEMRYNVVAVDELLTGGTDWALAARLRDNGGSALVFARLLEVDLRPGDQTELLTLESNLFPPAAGFRRLSTGRLHARPPGSSSTS